MDILSYCFTGNLTADATINVVNEQKSVINFTVASNLDAENTLFQNCSYWIKNQKPESSEQPKQSLVELLKKGTKITVFSNYLKKTNSVGEDGKNYSNTNVTVSKIRL